MSALIPRWLPSALILASFAALPAASFAAEDSPLRENTSLEFVPADVSFYCSMQRCGEICNRVADSKAYSKIRNSAPVQMGLLMLQAQLDDPDGPLAVVKAEMDKPENKELLALLADMFADEVFVYGDREWANVYQAYFDIYRQMYTSMLESGAIGRMEEDDAVFAEILEPLIDRLDELKIPTLVIGFRISDADRANRQLARLEKVLRPLVNSVPEIKGRLKRAKLGDSDMLTFSLDGGMIPWDELERDADSDEKRRVFEKVKENVEQRKIIATLGVKADCLLLTVSPSLKHLRRLGKGNLLIDRPELAPLVEMADRPIHSVSYASKAFLQHVTFGENTIDTWVAMGKAAVMFGAAEEGLDEKLADRIVRDIGELGEDVKRCLPKRGSMMSFSFLTGRGFEGYTYDWSQNLSLDGSKPLSLLNHVGGDPILFYACRNKYQPERYDLFVKWVNRVGSYIDEFVPGELAEDELAMYNQAKKILLPLLARIDTANRKMLMPAFRDGQGAFVLDARAQSEQWLTAMPPAEMPLAMIEPAFVFGVSDIGLLKKGVAEYVAVIDEGLKKARELAPDEIPPLTVPPPKTRQSGEGTIHFYPLPEEWGVDPRLAPNAGLSPDVVALSLSLDQTERLLKKTTLSLEGPLADLDRPLAAAAYFNFAGFVDAVHPWVEYGFNLATDGEANEDEANGPDGLGGMGSTPSAIISNVAELLKCFRGYSSATSFEDGGRVTHYELHFADIP